MALTQIVDQNAYFATEALRVLKWTPQGLEVVAESPPIGVIRALASGVVVGGTVGDLVIDVGQTTQGGTIQIWIIKGDTFDPGVQSGIKPGRGLWVNGLFPGRSGGGSR